jgi:hypothetical protein
MEMEWDERESVLDLLGRVRARLVGEAHQDALRLVRARGTVTSPEVLEEMRRRGFGPEIDRVDTRFMGCVFRDNKTWERSGWLLGRSSPGSHSRPVAIWRLR